MRAIRRLTRDITTGLRRYDCVRVEKESFEGDMNVKLVSSREVIDTT